MAQLDAAWNKMEEAVHTTTNSTEEILKMMEDLNNKCLAYEEWLHGANQVYDECGPIAADMERIQQQEVILEDLESDILNHKKMPEDFKLTVTDITKIAEEGTADTLNQRILALTNDYMSLGERVAERKELCEEAKKNLQDFATKEEPFNKMIEKVTKDFTAITSKPIRPIGNIQATLDEHVDYCIEVESQSVAFDDMNQLGRFIASHYPCDTFTAHLSSMFDQWIGFVDTLGKNFSFSYNVKCLGKLIS
jgi:chromosome segregation ATPase